jgi:RNA polymerase sigma-70 factor (ECF subfamily)
MRDANACSDNEDARLLARIAAGDRQAFERLYHLYFARLTRFLHRTTRSLPLVEEIVNDTMLVVWNKAPSWDASCKVSTWIFAIAWRRARKALSSANRGRGAGLGDAVEAEPELMEAAPDSQPDRQLALLRQHAAVDAALNALPAEQRAVVQLTYFHDMAYADIADVLGCPQNTVKTRMFYARRRLAALLADRQETP